jgi:murein DD-endopeptidase MepM/ murein hydrolase activator NlpD
MGTPVALSSPMVAASRRPTAVPAPRATPPAIPTPTPVPTPAAPATLTGYRSPLPHGRLTLPFGPSPWGSRLVEGETFHDGIDLATFCGDRVVAAHAGTVLAAGRRYDRYMGWVGDLEPYLDRLEKKKLWSTLPIVVVIDDGNGYRSVYAHFGKVVVKRGQAVQTGQLLGYEGRTGRASGCHVHYGLFSPLETATFAIDPDVVKRMKVPKLQIARVDPLILLPQHADKPKSSAKPAASPT